MMNIMNAACPGQGSRRATFLCIGIMAFFLLTLLIWFNVFGLYDAPIGFSTEKFSRISIGMTPAQVETVLGPPLKRVEVGAWNERCSEYWEYTKKPFYSMAYKRFTVFFDRSQRVSGTTIQMDS